MSIPISAFFGVLVGANRPETLKAVRLALIIFGLGIACLSQVALPLGMVFLLTAPLLDSASVLFSTHPRLDYFEETLAPLRFAPVYSLKSAKLIQVGAVVCGILAIVIEGPFLITEHLTRVNGSLLAINAV